MLKNETNCSFDLCEDSEAPQAFFEGSRRAMLGDYEEVSCTEWQGGEGEALWNGACMGNSTTPFWPEYGCGNVGTKHSHALRRNTVWVNVHSKDMRPIRGTRYNETRCW